MSKPKHVPLPCPFCGDNVEVEQVYPRDGYEIHHSYKEGCPLSERSFLWRKTRSTVVKLWNRRAEAKP